MKLKRKIRDRFKGVMCIALSAVLVATSPAGLSYADSKEEQGKLDKMMSNMGEAERILAELEACKVDTEKFIEIASPSAAPTTTVTSPWPTAASTSWA